MWNNKKQQQTYYHFKLDFQNVDQHRGGKRLIHGTKRHKDNQLQSLENSATVEVWKWISNIISHFTGHVNAYSCWDLSQPMIVKGAPEEYIDTHRFK